MLLLSLWFSVAFEKISELASVVSVASHSLRDSRASGVESRRLFLPVLVSKRVKFSSSDPPVLYWITVKALTRRAVEIAKSTIQIDPVNVVTAGKDVGKRLVSI